MLGWLQKLLRLPCIQKLVTCGGTYDFLMSYILESSLQCLQQVHWFERSQTLLLCFKILSDQLFCL